MTQQPSSPDCAEGGGGEAHQTTLTVGPLDAVAAFFAFGGCAYALALGRADTNVLALALFLIGAQYCHARFRDCHALRQSLEKTRQHRQLLEAIEVTPSPFALFDADNRLVVCNKAYQRLFPAAFGGASRWMKRRPIRFDEIVRAVARKSLPPDQVEDHVRARVDVHNRADGKPHDRENPDGSWYRMVKIRTPGGGVAGIATDISELKSREAELERLGAEARKAETLVTTVFELLGSGILVYDEEDRFVLCNSAMKAIYPQGAHVLTAGHTLKDYVWAGVRSGLWPDAEDSEEWVGAYVEKLRRPDWEFVNQLKDGRWLHAQNTRSPSGLFVGLRTDITGIKRDQAELARRLSEVEFFSAMVDALPVAAYLKDTDLSIRFVNKEWSRLTGFSQEQACGRTDVDLFGEEEGTVFMDGDRRVLATGAVDENIETITVPDGTVRTLLARKCRVATSRGEMKLIGFSLDMTEARQNQVELETAKRRLDETLAFMDQGLAAFDAAETGDQVLEYANARAAELLEVDDEALLVPGRKWQEIADFFHERGDFANQALDHRRIHAWMADSSENEPLTVERTLPSGRFIRSVCRKRSDGGRVVTYTDITDLRVRAQALETALCKAMAADRAKSEFLANMSHEIRTPMNGILGMAEILARTRLSSSQAGFVDIIVKSGNALLTIINDILDFSKIEADRLQLEARPFSLREAIEDVAALVSSRAAEKGLDLVMRVQPELPAGLVGDVGRFRQVVTNLLGNAVKFTDRGQVVVDVSGSRRAGASGEPVVDLMVTVKDTGAGIPADKVDTVFEKFSQLDNSSTRRHEGTGLGLAITRRLVELMGGEIGVSSVAGKGSSFWFSLPLAVDASEAAPRLQAPADVAAARVLVVDDNAVSRAMLMEQLAAWRFAPQAAAGGAEALRRLSEAAARGEGFDLLVIDRDMPDRDGARTIAAMRADPALAAVPAVLLTAVAPPEDAAPAHDTGPDPGHDAVLPKPPRSSLLFDVIVSALHGRTIGRGRAPARRKAPRSGEPGETPDVLVAEDNEVNQLVIEQLLTALGHTFTIVADGKAAVETVKAAPPRLILMDISMPVMDGLAATRAIREMEADGTPRIPIIGLTAHALSGDRDTCLAGGMDDYLSKPVSLDRLHEMIDRWLTAHAGEAPRRKSA